jgi:hypothetical protein
MDTETFLVLATGRRTAAQVGANVEIAGDKALGDKIIASLNMMI